MPSIFGMKNREPSLDTQKETKTQEPNDVGIFLAKSLDDYLASIPDFGNSGGRFYASAVGNPCDRFLYLHYKGLLPKKKIPAQLRRIFDHGNVVQGKYSKYFTAMGLLLGEEITARSTYPPINGRADFLLRLPPHYEKYIIEMKTIKDSDFGDLLRNNAPKADHKVQLQCYLNILNIPAGAVLYEDKDNQKMKFFHMERSVNDWNEIVARCQRIINLTEMPSIESGHSSYCDCLLVADNA